MKEKIIYSNISKNLENKFFYSNYFLNNNTGDNNMETSTTVDPFSKAQNSIRKALGKEIKYNSPLYPYAEALCRVSSINDTYGVEDAKSIALYFLSNGSSWKGEEAKESKAILKKLTK